MKEKKSKDRDENFSVGDLVFWYTNEKNGVNKTYFGTIIYRYVQEEKLKSFLVRKKTMAYTGNEEELKQFFINEIVEMGTGKTWKLDDRYILLVICAKTFNT